MPFIVTFATMLAASGSGLLLAQDRPSRFPTRADSPISARATCSAFRCRPGSRRAAYVVGSMLLNLTSSGRTVLAIGGNEDAARLMGLPGRASEVRDLWQRARFPVLAGVILASQFGAGQPIEGVGWELFAIASVVVGGHAADGRPGFRWDDPRGRPAARTDVQCPEFRERPRLDQLPRLLAVRDPGRVPAPGRDVFLQARLATGTRRRLSAFEGLALREARLDEAVDRKRPGAAE